MKYTIEVDAIVGSVVQVHNYRTADNRWERGVVERVEVILYPDGKRHISYTVQLTAPPPQGELRRRLYVDEEEIRT